MRRLRFDTKNQSKLIKTTASVLQKGGLIVFPSDTVYGLGVDPTNKSAVDKLFQIKSRRIDKAVSVLVSDQAMAAKYVVLDQSAKNFYANFLPGPFTVVSKVKRPTKLDKRIYSESDTLGVRIPDFPFLTNLAKQLGQPFTATSANISGKSPHYAVDGFLKSLSQKRKDLIDLVIDAGKLPRRKPSTVVDLSMGEVKQLRAGDISFGKGKKYTTASAKQTKALAEKIVKEYYTTNKPFILALVGNLGAGKTTFCQGIGSYFGISRVNSPTFLIAKEYKLPQGMFYHIDTYRLEKGEEIRQLGFDKMLKPGNIIAIEWAEKVRGILESIKGSKIVWLFIKPVAGNKRDFKLFV